MTPLDRTFPLAEMDGFVAIGKNLDLNVSGANYELLQVDAAIAEDEIKTIVTRAGEGTKIVLTGDPYQIDNPYIDASSNGLTYAVEKFKGQDIAGHVTLDKGERSILAELAANLL